MRILRQLLIILGVWLCGEFISRGLNLPIPGNVIGMFLMLLLLLFRVVKIPHVMNVSNFFLDNISFFFIPGAVALLVYYKQIQGQILQVLAAIVLSSVLVFLVTGYTVEGLLRLKKHLSNKKGQVKDDAK